MEPDLSWALAWDSDCKLIDKTFTGVTVMLKNTLIGLIVGTSLSSGGLFIDSASAQNISDNTGANISSFTPSVTPGFSSSLVTQGEQFATDIIEALNSNTPGNLFPAANNPSPGSSDCLKRRFSLDKPDPKRNCNKTENSQSARLNTLSSEADQFLENIFRQAEKANSEIAKSRLW
ncbi:MAG: hypothetical protein ACFB2X_11020 [Rivularia sp. (in: cyanobacteria)]